MPAPTPRNETPLTPAQRWTRSLAVLVVGLALLMLLDFPWALGALVLGPLTAIAGVVVLSSRGANELTTWGRINAIVAIVLGAFSTMTAAAMLLFLGPLNDLAECNARAITTSARQACQAEFDQTMQDFVEGYLGELTTG